MTMTDRRACDYDDDDDDDRPSDRPIYVPDDDYERPSYVPETTMTTDGPIYVPETTTDRPTNLRARDDRPGFYVPGVD